MSSQSYVAWNHKKSPIWLPSNQVHSPGRYWAAKSAACILRVRQESISRTISWIHGVRWSWDRILCWNSSGAPVSSDWSWVVRHCRTAAGQSWCDNRLRSSGYCPGRVGSRNYPERSVPWAWATAPRPRHKTSDKRPGREGWLCSRLWGSFCSARPYICSAMASCKGEGNFENCHFVTFCQIFGVWYFGYKNYNKTQHVGVKLAEFICI